MAEPGAITKVIPVHKRDGLDYALPQGVHRSAPTSLRIPGETQRNPGIVERSREVVLSSRTPSRGWHNPQNHPRPMRILLTGASGFIGRHLIDALHRAGHVVVCSGRSAEASVSCAEFVHADFTRDFHVADWIPRLRGIEVVINAVGILREKALETFELIHERTPRALFDACVIAGVRRVIQISALGADEGARSQYHLSKRRADQYLASLPIVWTIVQPSLIYGADGQSARLFTQLASLPWIPVPGSGTQLIQPVHIDDVTAGLCALIDTAAGQHCIVPFVGPAPMELGRFLSSLRDSMGLPGTRFLGIPQPVMRFAARAAEHLPRSLLSRESLDMLLRGNTGDAQPLQSILGRPARPAAQFITEQQAAATRISGQLGWLLPLLRYSIAVVWIVTGLVSLGLFPAASSYELLSRVGVPGALQPVFLYGAAGMDLVFGILTLRAHRARYVWLAQMLVIVGYTVIISVRMPEFWLHPFGPLLKNLPMLAAISVLYYLERR